MYFKCIKPFFNGIDAANNIIVSNDKPSGDLSLNDFQITIADTTCNLSTYIDIINTLLNDKTQITTAAKNPISVNKTTSKMEFKMDIQKLFDKNDYRIDISGTALNTVLKVDNKLQYNLSTTNTFTGDFPISGAGYVIDGDLMIINPNPTSFNRWIKPYIIKGDTTRYADIQDLQLALREKFTTYVDDDNIPVLSQSTVTISQSGNRAIITITINVTKIIDESAYKVIFTDASANPVWSITDKNNSWAYNLKISDSSFNWSGKAVTGKSYSLYTTNEALGLDTITLTTSNNKIRFDPVLIDDGGDGIYTDTMTNSVIIEVPVLVPYSRDGLFDVINEQLSKNTITNGTKFSGITTNSADYTQISFNINKIYTQSDYRLVFYDPFSFVTCNVGSSSVQNTTWDSTLGWIMGFRASTEYDLSDYTNLAKIIGDNVVSISIYNYFMIVLDDYNQSHMNSGIVTTTQSDTDIPLPAYTNRALIQCDPITKMPITSTVGKDGTNLTRSSIYAQQAIADDKIASKNTKKYSSGPFTKDVFALVPLKLAGLANNSVYVADGGTLQNQERTYFGPVNISRMTVKLVNDRGELVNLNGADWSFSFICEQLYKQ